MTAPIPPTDADDSPLAAPLGSDALPPPVASTAGESQASPPEIVEPPRSDLVLTAPSWLASLLLHLGVLLLLALWTLPLTHRQPAILSATTAEEENLQFEELVELDVSALETEDLSLEEVAVEATPEAVELELESLTDSASPALADDAFEVVDFAASIGDLEALTSGAGMSAMGLEGRAPVMRSRMVLKGGGNSASEKAVAEALRWLARHQLADGSWNFDHRGGECEGRCGNPGDLVRSPAGATGLALLPFLGAGNTHTSGDYQEVVERGAYALMSMLQSTPEGATVPDDDQYKMYCHGIAAMALCESFAMTDDPNIGPAAQAVLAYTCYAQDPEGGGWRYKPRQRGDTSMHGWHVGALKSGYMASLEVPEIVVQRANYYLDTAAVDGGTGYAYTIERPTYGPATSAIGLLCRMYMGTTRDDPALKAGIERLVKRGPDRGPNGAYFNYYAAQAIFQYTSGVGPLWEAWNEPMRDFLVQSQETEGHEAGSWSPFGDGGGSHVKHGGRLYQTAMCCMTLEVYYRLMPIYQEAATQGGFE